MSLTALNSETIMSSFAPIRRYASLPRMSRCIGRSVHDLVNRFRGANGVSWELIGRQCIHHFAESARSGFVRIDHRPREFRALFNASSEGARLDQEGA